MKVKKTILVGGPDGQTTEISGMVEQDENHPSKLPVTSEESFTLLDKDPEYAKYSEMAGRIAIKNPGKHSDNSSVFE